MSEVEIDALARIVAHELREQQRQEDRGPRGLDEAYRTNARQGQSGDASATRWARAEAPPRSVR